jgi:hypothetical protein
MILYQASNMAAAKSPEKPSAPAGPARMVLPVPDEPARGRWGDSNRIAPDSVPVFRDESAAVAGINPQYVSGKSI